MPGNKNTRLRQTTILLLPQEEGEGKELFLYFPAFPGARIRPTTSANVLIEQVENGEVVASWSPVKKANDQNSDWVSIRSPFGGISRVFAVKVKLDPPPVDLLLPPGRDRFLTGDLILVTVTITVPATGGQPEIVEAFEIEATTIPLP
jgi:hypothetical protein